MTTKHTTHIDGTRLDIEKKSHSIARCELEVQVSDSGDAYKASVDLERALGYEADIDSTRDIGVGVVAEAVAALLDSLDHPTDSLIQARVYKKQPVREVYGPERDHHEWLDAPTEEFDEAMEKRRRRSRQATQR
jgi:hypothetical protein